MTLKQKNWLCVGMMLTGAGGLVLASHAQNAVRLLTALACLIVLGGLLLHMRLVRCPHCGTWVGKFPGDYCKHCGEPLNWDG